MVSVHDVTNKKTVQTEMISETEQDYSYNPGAHTGHQPTKAPPVLYDLSPVTV